MTMISESMDLDDLAVELARAFARLPENDRRRCRHVPTGNRNDDTLVQVDAEDGSQWLKGVVVDGERDAAGVLCLGEEFVVFSVTANARGELIRCEGWRCHVERYER